jgi:hypothetical protein
VVDARTLALDNGLVGWLQAGQFIMRLVDYRVVDLDAEAAGGLST